MLRYFVNSCFLSCALLLNVVARAQNPIAPLALDVVSVRPSAPDIRLGEAHLTDDGISESGNPLSWLLTAAFNLRLGNYLINVPGWARSTRYDVQAKVDEADVSRFKTLSREQQWALLQPMLIERFKLRFHREQRSFPVYSLRVMPGGPHLKSTPDDVKSSAAFRGRYVWNARGYSMQQLCSMLSSEMPGEPRDATGLTGRYDIVLHWSRQNLSPDAEVPSDVDIFKALREQLGLEMVRSAEPVSVVVIDRLDRPDSN